MRKIPATLREEMANDLYYHKCAKSSGECHGKIEWHHHLIFGGKQVNEKFCIIPLCKFHHDNIVRFKEEVDWIMLNRATKDELLFYSKAVDYLSMKKRLNQKYGEAKY